MTGLLQIMNPTGDTKIEWDVANAFEIEEARASWNRHKAKGYIGYRLNPDGSTGAIIPEFDPQAGWIVMRPPVRGG